MVTILLDDGTKLTFSERGYSQFYLYQGKTLTTKEMNALKEAETLDPFHLYLQRMFARGRYSEKAIRQKLYARKAQRYQVEQLVSEYKHYGLIDDASLMLEWMDYYHDKNLGVRAIQRKLEEKGFDSIHVQQAVQPKNEEQKAKVYLPVLLKKTKHLPLLEKKQRIYTNLLAKGFDANVISTMLDHVKDVDEEAVDEHGKKTLLLAQKRYQRQHNGKALQQRLISYMRSKGYTMTKILSWLGEQEHDND